MTLDQFLDDYVPRVLRPMGWKLVGPAGFDTASRDTAAYVRRFSPPWTSCPLTAEAGDPCDRWKVDGLAVGLSLADCYRVLVAADGETLHCEPMGDDIPEIRARLLAGLGLAEPR